MEQKEDDLRPEYDLRKLRVRNFGRSRNSFGSIIVRIDPDVAAAFPNAEAVNQALRAIIKEQNSPKNE
jgi:hypothetical protein